MKNEPNESPEVQAQRAKLAKTLKRVRDKKRKNDAREKRLISRTDAERVLRPAFAKLRTRLQQLPEVVAVLAQHELPEEVRNLLRQTVDEAIVELDAGLKETGLDI